MSRGPGTVVTELGVEDPDYPGIYHYNPEMHHPCNLGQRVTVTGHPKVNFNVFVTIDPCSHPDCRRFQKNRAEIKRLCSLV